MIARYSLAAADEFEQAIDWHDRHKPGLGSELASEVRTTLNQVLADPDRFGRAPGGPRDRNVRRARVARFAYDVIYEPRGDTIVIVAFAHHSRRPGYWRRRLKP